MGINVRERGILVKSGLNSRLFSWRTEEIGRAAERGEINFLAPRLGAVCFARPPFARVVELVDTQVSEACAERCSGSSPLPGTTPV